MKPVGRLGEPFVEVPCSEGSTKVPWRVHEKFSKGPWKNFVGFLHDAACNRVGSILYCFLGPELLSLRNPLQSHEIFLPLPPKWFDISPPFWVDAHRVSMRSYFSVKSRHGYKYIKFCSRNIQRTLWMMSK